tara:strand:+ start:1502 stop:2407 length:906 start_codon:yes stop_codon:yes gene_type:complete
LKFLITGGTGLIGTRLSQLLIDNGHSVNILTRKIKNQDNSSLKYFVWNTSKKTVDNKCIDGVDVIINLAGSSVFSLWTKSNKKMILKSRLDSLSIIYKLIKEKKNKVKRIVSASAIGIYPNHKSKVYYENSNEISDTFLGNVVYEWEKKAKVFSEININLSIIRIGLVLSENGGMLEKLLKLNNLGISSIINDGNQCQSWIHIDDLVNIFLFTSLNNINGLVNGVAPSPVSFKELQNNISSNYKKPFLSLNFPKWLLKIPLSFLGLSDFYNDIIGSNKRVSSKKIQDLGYKFIYPSLDKLK